MRNQRHDVPNAVNTIRNASFQSGEYLPPKILKLKNSKFPKRFSTQQQLVWMECYTNAAHIIFNSESLWQLNTSLASLPVARDLMVIAIRMAISTGLQRSKTASSQLFAGLCGAKAQVPVVRSVPTGMWFTLRCALAKFLKEKKSPGKSCRKWMA